MSVFIFRERSDLQGAEVNDNPRSCSQTCRFLFIVVFVCICMFMNKAVLVVGDNDIGSKGTWNPMSQENDVSVYDFLASQRLVVLLFPVSYLCPTIIRFHQKSHSFI